MTLRSLAAENLTCIRGHRLVFRNLGFRVGQGGVLSLEGPNGAGKTSLLRMIAGFLSPAAGSIVLSRDGGEISDGEERGHFVGWLGHKDAAKPQLTARETLLFFRRLYFAEPDQPKIEAVVDEHGVQGVLDYVGLGKVADLPCQYLSAGQKKRLALARLLLSARPLWLLDEPLAALDTAGKLLAAQFISSHAASGGIAVVATHESLGIDCARLMLS